MSEMCNLCGDDDVTRGKARQEALCIADRLERAAGFYRRLARGEVKPHSDASATFAHTALALVRELVAEWV
jgi:hypothetical protein